jgi:DNA-binding CsgD family transcriptional regulator
VKSKYQFKLEGWTSKWSDWQEGSSQIFENLPSGDYTFKVRGKVGNLPTSNVASYDFKIHRPWYFSNIFIAVYIIILLLLFLLIHNIYKYNYKKQKEALLVRSKKELALKELENKQIQTELNNEKLKLDFDNKSRELAISTMSLIKKNQFLNDIKDRLLKITQPNDLKKVIKIIDKNINSTDDWDLFEEAFNNADKEFLSKIKTVHPDLTPNDLKLCAYLRLNLTSKEIAPLLNISTKSVEVKRYRLRKKMDLEHKTSLTKYILEI